MGEQETTKRYNFTLRPTVIEQLKELSKDYEGNLSMTIRYVIEAAYQQKVKEQ